MKALLPNGLASDEKEDDYLSGRGQVYQLMLFLWAIKNLRYMRVTISDTAPTSELFDIPAQGWCLGAWNRQIPIPRRQPIHQHLVVCPLLRAMKNSNSIIKEAHIQVA
jgi:hypothetical protein